MFPGGYVKLWGCIFFKIFTNTEKIGIQDFKQSANWKDLEDSRSLFFPGNHGYYGASTYNHWADVSKKRMRFWELGSPKGNRSTAINCHLFRALQHLPHDARLPFKIWYWKPKAQNKPQCETETLMKQHTFQAVYDLRHLSGCVFCGCGGRVMVMDDLIPTTLKQWWKALW